MRTSTLIAAALAAATSVAGLDAQRPRIYFPRHVKREFTNSSIPVSSAAPQTSADAALPTPPPLLPLPLTPATAPTTTSSPTFSSLLVGPATIIIPTSSTSPQESLVSSLPQDSIPASINSTALSSDVPSSPTPNPVLPLPPGLTPVSSGRPLASPTALPIGTGTAASHASSARTTSALPSSSDYPLLPEIPLPPLSHETSSTRPGIVPSSSWLPSGSTLPTASTGTFTSGSVQPTPIIVLPPGVLPSSAWTPTSGRTSLPPGVSAPAGVAPTGITSSSGPAPTGSQNSTVSSLSGTLPVGLIPSTATGRPSNTSTYVTPEVPATSLAPPAPSTTEQAPGVVSQTPTATFTPSQPWLPSTIVIAPPAPTAPEPSTVPSALPKAITPDTGLSPMPEGTTLIQVGFLFGLNYPFVVQNTKAAAQIFELLPQALAYGGSVDASKVQMRRLMPLNTLKSLGYITTLGVVTWPSNLVDALQLDIRLPNSKLYANPNQLVYNLTMEINPAISIGLGSVPDDGAQDSPSTPGGGTTGGGGGGGGGGAPNGDPFNNDGSDTSQNASQRGTTAAIVVSSVGVAAAYGVAMFVIARRYKRKRQSHRRTSSMSDPSEARQAASPALMGGALLSGDYSNYGGAGGSHGSAGPGAGQGTSGPRLSPERDSHGSGRSGMGNSARTAFISGPMAAENSLGWN